MTFADLVYKFFAVLYNNKQSILATLVTALAYVQGSDQLKNALSSDTYAWLMFGVGLLMIVFARSASEGGPINTVMSLGLPGSIPKDLPPKEGA